VSDRPRALVFPGEISVGTVSWEGTTGVPAKGELIIPESARVSLHLSRAGLRESAQLARLPPDAFSTISVRKNVGLGMQELLPNLSHFVGLERLDLSENPTVRDEHLAFLQSFPGLLSLDLRATRVTGEGLAQHRSVHAALYELRATGRVTSAIGTYVSGVSLGALELACPGSGSVLEALDTSRLRSLAIADKEGLTGTSLAVISEAAALEELDLRGTHVHDTELAHLGRLKRLAHLSLGESVQAYAYSPGRYGARGPVVTDAGLPHLSLIRSLRTLDLSFNEIEGRAFPHLAQLTGLQKLNLGCNAVDDAGLLNLPAMPSLRRLDLFGNPITSKGAGALTRQPNLRWLDLRATFAARAQGIFAESLPECFVDTTGAFEEEEWHI
jgi:Leucine-rich repeat (LRR) protein